MKPFSALIFVAALGAGSATAKPLSLFEVGSHCVAYKVKKRLFLVRTVDVVGKNCHITSQVVPEVGGKFHLQARIPLSAFDSGESDRDRDVVKILKGDEKTEIQFQSVGKTPEEWRELFKSKQFKLEGTLQVAQGQHPVVLQANLQKGPDGWEMDGIVQTKFKNLGIRPPRIWGGLMAKVKQPLEMHFHVLGQKTLGVESIL